MEKPAIYNIDTFAAKAGIGRRTVHYYLKRGLLMPPYGQGRGSYYTDEHLRRMKDINQLSAQGVPLGKIKEFFDCGGILPQKTVEEDQSQAEKPEPDSEEFETWERHPITKGIELNIKTSIMSADKTRELVEAIKIEINKRIPK